MGGAFSSIRRWNPAGTSETTTVTRSTLLSLRTTCVSCRLAPWVFMQNELQTTLVSRRVGNYQYNPQWGPLLDQLWVR